MHAAYDAHDEAALLRAVHEGHQDLASFLYVTNTLHLLQEKKRPCGPRKGRGPGKVDGIIRDEPVKSKRSSARACAISTTDSRRPGLGGGVNPNSPVHGTWGQCFYS